MWEKMLKIHQKPLWVRLPLRLPLSGAVWLISVAFPFYNLINSILGAFTSSFETYIIPAVVFNWVYRTKAARDACPKPPYRWSTPSSFLLHPPPPPPLPATPLPRACPRVHLVPQISTATVRLAMASRGENPSGGNPPHHLSTSATGPCGI